MRVLVTGGAGFIGSHLTDRLLQNGYSTIVFDNLLSGRIDNLKEAFKNPDFTFKQIDLCRKDDLFKAMEGFNFDIVFHFAANSDISKGIENSDIDFNNTFLSSYNVLLAMKKYGIKKFVFASSSAVFGERKDSASEDSAIAPISNYGAAKAASEAFISSFCESCNIQSLILRFPNVIGERASHGVIYDFIRKLNKNPYELTVLGNGKQAKPYLYVQELIDAVLFILKNTDEKIGYYNIAPESQVLVSHIAEIVIKAMKLNARIKYTGSDRGWTGDVPKFSYCLDKIHNLGWRAQLTSDEAVQKAVKCILEKDNICRQ